MRIGLALAALAAAAFAAPPASAQYYHTRRPAYAAPDYYAPAAGFYCRPLCPQDVTPCDPPEFKRADGRCVNPASGGFR